MFHGVAVRRAGIIFFTYVPSTGGVEMKNYKSPSALNGRKIVRRAGQRRCFHENVGDDKGVVNGGRPGRHCYERARKIGEDILGNRVF